MVAFITKLILKNRDLTDIYDEKMEIITEGWFNLFFEISIVFEELEF